jgi:tetratricopeptide (TPR) repeat protein
MRVHRACMFAAAALGAVVLFGCSTPTAITKFDKAQDLQKDGKHSAAIENYNTFIKESGKDYPKLLPYAQYEIGYSYRCLNKMNEARDAYKKVLDLYPTSEQAQWAKDEMKVLDKATEATPPAKVAPAPATTTEPAAK